MKIQRQLVILLSGVLATIVILAILLRIGITNKSEELLRNNLVETKSQDAQKAIDINAALVKNICYDYSTWNQMVEYVSGQRPATWPAQELDDNFFNYGVEYIWVLDSNANKLYSSCKNKQLPFDTLPVSTASLKKKLATDKEAHFFINHNGRLIEIFHGAVTPTTDKERKSAPRGHLVVGKVLDSGYVKKLGSVFQDIEFTILPPDKSMPELVNARQGSIQFNLPLTDINGAVLANMGVSRHYPIFPGYYTYLANAIKIFVGLIIAICLLFYIFSERLLLQPIQSLMLSLKLNNASTLFKLNKSKNEYGQIARLVTEFFYNSAVMRAEIEHRKNTEKALQQAYKEKENANIDKIRAEQAMLAKSQFLSTMSHEIRTPINGVVGISNLLMDEDLTEKQKDYVKTLHFSANHLMSVVSDILDFSKIDAGNLHFEKASFNLQTICGNVFALFKQKAEEKNIEYVFNPCEIQGFSLYGDYVRLSQVLSNLLSNAVKFTDRGSVHFSYKIASEAFDSIAIQFTVKDTGIGIAPDKLHKVFDSFSQADDSITRRYGGTGLGLTISKKIVELQGGEIKVESKENEGAAFSVTLRFEKHAYTNPSSVISIHKATQTNLEGMRVLVAEDNHINAKVITRFLEKWKVTCKVASDGVEALKILDNEAFDVVLMDLQMPNMDGIEATRQIRMAANEKLKAIPVAALTAEALVDTHRRLLNEGFDHCITKPFSPDALFAYLKKHYKSKESASLMEA
jgi:signal transduction histidine kinase/CheY-like chemotaxis protein